MSAGIGIVGRQVLMTIGGVTIAGVQNKGMTCNNERLETGDDQAAGWAEAMAIPGEKAVTIPFSGILKNLGFIAAYYNGGGEGSQMFECQLVYPDGSTVEGDFFLDSLSETGEYKGLKTFDASISSSGEVIFTPGSAS